jgi:flagellar biosynthesis component FlhA
MQVLIGGVVAAVLGLVGLIAWWKEFLLILMGGIPVALLLGGALAIYVGYDELKDQMREKKEKEKEGKEKSDELRKTKEELEKAKEEVEKLKAEKSKAKK